MLLKTRLLIVILMVSMLILVATYWYFNKTKTISVTPIEQQSLIKLADLDLELMDLSSNDSPKVTEFTEQELLAMFHDPERKVSKRVLEEFLRLSKISNEKLYGIDGDMLTQAEAREILSHKVSQNRAVRARWNEPRGISHRKSQLYRGYDEEVLRSLANQGDIYAMQSLAWIALFWENNFEKSTKIMLRAAIEGSVGALFEQAGRISAIVSIGKDDLNVIAKDSGLKHPPGKAKEALIMLAAAYYTVGQFRGNVQQGDIGKELLREYHLSGRDFTAEEEENIYIISRALYEKLSKAREKRGLPVFDNSYMPNYREGTLPQENNFMEEYFNSFKNLNP